MKYNTVEIPAIEISVFRLF